MNAKQANEILQSITKDDQQEARNLLQWLAKNMKGGNWDKLDQPQKLIVMISFAMVYGWKKGVQSVSGKVKDWFIIYRNKETGGIEVTEKAGATAGEAIALFRQDTQHIGHTILQVTEMNDPEGVREIK